MDIIGEAGMKLYRKLIRPMHSYPGPDYSPRIMPIEKEVKWYPEEERKCLEKKYASYNEGPFSDLIFEEKFEPYAIEPKFKKHDNDIVRCKDCKHRIDGCCYSRKSNQISFGAHVAYDWFCAYGERKEGR